MPVDLFVSALVERLQFPTHDSMGTPVTYRLVADGKALPGYQSFLDLHIQPGTQVRLDVNNADYPTVPETAKHPLKSFFGQRIGRRDLLSTGSILITCSVAGFLSGTSTVLAQHVWGHIGGMNSLPVATPHVQQTMPFFQQQLRFTAHNATVRAIAWSPDGALLSSGADDTMLLLWMSDGTVKKRVTLPDAIRAVAWSPGGKRIAVGSGTAVAFVNAQNGLLLALPQVHNAAVTSVAWSAHIGSPVVSGSLDRRAVVWQTQDYRPQGSFTKHTAPIDAVTAVPGDGTTIASSSEGGVIRVWDLDTLQEVHGFYQDAAVAMLSAAFAPDGIRLAVGGQDGSVRVWGSSLTCQRSVVTGGEQSCADAPQRLQGHSAAVRAVAWSSDGKYLATGGDDAQVIVWDSAANFAQVTKITHDAPVNTIAWSPHHQIVATASGNAVQIWKLL